MASTTDVHAVYQSHVERFSRDVGLPVDVMVQLFMLEEFYQLYVRVTEKTGDYGVEVFEKLATGFFATSFNFEVPERQRVLQTLLSDDSLFEPVSSRVLACIDLLHGTEIFCVNTCEEAIASMRAQLRLMVNAVAEVNEPATSQGDQQEACDDAPFFPSSLSPAPTTEPRVIRPVPRRTTTQSHSPPDVPAVADPGLPTSLDRDTREPFCALLPMFCSQLALTKNQVWEQVITPGVAAVVQQLAYHSRSVRQESATFRILTLMVVRFLCVIPRADHERFLTTVAGMASTIEPCSFDDLLDVSRSIVLETERNSTLANQVCGMMALLPAVYRALLTEAKMMPKPLKRLISEGVSPDVWELHNPLRSFVVPNLSMVKLRVSWKKIHETSSTTRKRNQANDHCDDDDEWLPNKRHKHLDHQ